MINSRGVNQAIDLTLQRTTLQIIVKKQCVKLILVYFNEMVKARAKQLTNL